MKKTIILLVAVLLLHVSCKESAASKVKTANVEKAKERDVAAESLPVVSFDKEVFDFGTIDEGDIVETSFEVTNVGKSDLIISKAKASCGCTVPTWPKEAIKPGETATIEVKFNSRGKKNKQSKAITLTTNTINGREIVKISGFVTPKEKK
jgi:hypothetical protein